MPILRLGLLCLLLAGFAWGFAELVDRAGDREGAAPPPCSAGIDPAC
jgi:hypothetical protein